MAAAALRKSFCPATVENLPSNKSPKINHNLKLQYVMFDDKMRESVVKEMAWLIDDSGVAWPNKAHLITQWDAGCDPPRYAVSDRGFIHLRVLDGAVTVSFNPSRVGRTTMISAFYVISDEHPKRIALSHGDNDRDLEIFGTVAQAFGRIEELVESHPPPIPVLSLRQRSLHSMPKEISEPIIGLLCEWSNTGRQWSPERLADLSTTVPLKDVVVNRSPHGTDRLVNDHWGASFDFLGSRWARIAVGKEIEDQPFPAIGKRIASSYRRMLANGEPRLADIDLALLSAGRVIRSLRCTHLVLPWSEPGGDRYVTTIRFDRDPSAT